jgi:hypothetical protein
MYYTTGAKDGSFFVRSGVHVIDEPAGTGWTKILDAIGTRKVVNQISCGLNGYLWGVDTSKGILYMRVGITKHNIRGSKWQVVKGTSKNAKTTHVSVGELGEVWTIELATKIGNKFDINTHKI